jgi:O-antigen ligase
MKNKKINNTSGFVKLNKLNNFFPFIYICTKKKGKKQLIRKAHEHGWAFNHRIALLGLIIIIILFCKGEENMLSPFFLKKKMT